MGSLSFIPSSSTCTVAESATDQDLGSYSFICGGVEIEDEVFSRSRRHLRNDLYPRATTEYGLSHFSGFAKPQSKSPYLVKQ